jgi:hypothetical protein
MVKRLTGHFADILRYRCSVRLNRQLAEGILILSYPVFYLSSSSETLVQYHGFQNCFIDLPGSYFSTLPMVFADPVLIACCALARLEIENLEYRHQCAYIAVTTTRGAGRLLFTMIKRRTIISWLKNAGRPDPLVDATDAIWLTANAD